MSSEFFHHLNLIIGPNYRKNKDSKHIKAILLIWTVIAGAVGVGATGKVGTAVKIRRRLKGSKCYSTWAPKK
jgi:hypothetical protein